MFGLFSCDIGIDLGTANTLVHVAGQGIVINEPTVIAVDSKNNRVSAIGFEAKKMLGRTPGESRAVRPMRDGVIADFELVETLLQTFIKRVQKYPLWMVKPRVVVGVPSGITEVEKRAVIDAAIEAGARRVYLLETAVATAMGAGVDISKADGHMVIDIGGGTTEIAIISVGGVVECESIKVAGASFDEAIVKYVRHKHNMLIGLGTAEELKRSIGCVIQRPDVGMEEIKGRSLTNGLPKTVTISANELIEAFVEPMNHILESIHTVLERTPPQLVGDLDSNGIIMSGGGSLIYGIDRLIERSTGIRTMVVDDPISCAAYGAGKMLSHLNDMQDGMMNFYRKRQLKG